MEYINNFKKGYLTNKESVKETFPEAYNFLIQIETLESKGFHVGTHLNLNLYYKTQFILHFSFGIDNEYMAISGKPNGTLKNGIVDNSKLFLNFFNSKLDDFKKDSSNTIEIFDDDLSFWIYKTEKSALFFKILLDTLLEYSDKSGLIELSNEINELANEQQIFVDLNNLSDAKLLEGIQKTITATVYERNQTARTECLNHWKYSCLVCGFNFEKTYGELGKNYIHVHHIRQISTRKEEYEIDPINDLVPVCPNCHSMIHKNKEPLTIDELRNLISKNKKAG
jgi:predicted HNH restriction endonuclease